MNGAGHLVGYITEDEKHLVPINIQSMEGKTEFKRTSIAFNHLLSNRPLPVDSLKKETVIEITKIPDQTGYAGSLASQDGLMNAVTTSDHQSQAPVTLQYRPHANTNRISHLLNQPTPPYNQSKEGVVSAVNNHLQQQTRGFNVVLPPSSVNKRYTILSTEGLFQASCSGDQLNSNDSLNTSLTNIQWLGTMSGDTLVRNNNQINHKVFVSEQQIEKVSRECGRDKRPPFSYMSMIQMAINSKPDKRMTLREIYGWIEGKFPYYRFTAKQGWKNSIRHNLSLYDIFVRERVSTPGLVGSFWTLRKEDPYKKPTVQQGAGSKIAPKPSLGSDSVTASPFNTSLGIIAAPGNSDWTIVPLQTIQLLQSTSATNTEKHIPSSLKRSCDLRTPAGTKKHVKIAPRVSVCDGSQLISQAWLNASLSAGHFSEQLSSSGFCVGLSSSGTESPSHDSGFESQVSEKSVVGSHNSVTQPLLQPSRKKLKGRRRQRKAVNKTRNDSLDPKPPVTDIMSTSGTINLSDSFLAGLESGFSSPIRQLLLTPPKFSESRATSTPYRVKDRSPQFSTSLCEISPLRSLHDANLTPCRRGNTSLNPTSLMSPEHQRNPGTGSMRDFGFQGLTPLCPSRNTSLGNTSFSKLFADFPLDGVDENGSVDLENISWPEIPMV